MEESLAIIGRNNPLAVFHQHRYSSYELKCGVSALDRIYVKVSSDFDSTGYMQPRAILWPDGRLFNIDEVRAFRPAGDSHLLDCYTVIIHGQERRLFFERSGDRLGARLGRWYVET